MLSFTKFTQPINDLFYRTHYSTFHILVKDSRGSCVGALIVQVLCVLFIYFLESLIYTCADGRYHVQRSGFNDGSVRYKPQHSRSYDC